ncbi:transcriptional regulator, ArsR family protein, partial [Rhizobium sp. Pop5]
VLKAAGEPTRLRLLALLDGGDLTVTDLTEILGQSHAPHLPPPEAARRGRTDRTLPGRRLGLFPAQAGRQGGAARAGSAKTRLRERSDHSSRRRAAVAGQTPAGGAGPGLFQPQCCRMGRASPPACGRRGGRRRRDPAARQPADRFIARSRHWYRPYPRASVRALPPRHRRRCQPRHAERGAGQSRQVPHHQGDGPSRRYPEPTVRGAGFRSGDDPSGAAFLRPAGDCDLRSGAHASAGRPARGHRPCAARARISPRRACPCPSRLFAPGDVRLAAQSRARRRAGRRSSSGSAGRAGTDGHRLARARSEAPHGFATKRRRRTYICRESMTWL